MSKNQKLKKKKDEVWIISDGGYDWEKQVGWKKKWKNGQKAILYTSTIHFNTHKLDLETTIKLYTSWKNLYTN